ncbi:MAG: sulfotransferase domain-containing protein [Bacteroidia bacterium]
MAAQRIKAQYPNIKLIFIVRDPVQRALSNYFHSLRYGYEQLAINEAFDRPMLVFEQEFEKMKTTPNYHSYEYHTHGYVYKSFYAKQLKLWLQHFNANQILVLENNEMLNQPQKVYNQVLKFLNLPEFTLTQFGKHNVGKTQKVSDEFINQLKAEFKQPNQEFFDLVGRKFDW